MKVGILTDGKYGDRAFENISKVFPCEWIQLEEAPRTAVLDDYDLNIPECDMYISYLRHPDQVLAAADLGKPILLGISFGEGFLRQVRKINPKVFAFPTMCSTEPKTGVPEIDEFARHFGSPVFEAYLDNEKIEKLEVLRSSPCGSSEAGSKFIKGKPISIPVLQEFALNVCYECRAPRFGKTCDKELSGIIHLKALVSSLEKAGATLDPSISEFIDNLEREYQNRSKKT
ncbi:MAG: DUF166 family protein [Candidatus Freyarchaeum deiterrae]